MFKNVARAYFQACAGINGKGVGHSGMENSRGENCSDEKNKVESSKAENSKPENNSIIAPMTRIHMVPMDVIAGFEVRPGMYDINGATAIPGGVNFTIYSYGATSCELLLFRRGEDEPFAVLPFPEN